MGAYGVWCVVLVIVAASLLAANEIGYRIGRRQHERSTADQRAAAGVVIGAFLALLGLLLAFSFSIVEGRFAMRKRLVLEEANALSTVYLRTRTLHQPHRGRLQRMLTEYASLRVRARDPDALDAALRRSPELHEEMWVEMVAVAERQPESEIVGLFEASLNQLIDLFESRVAVALYERLPRPILWTVVAVSILGLLVLGYGEGLARSRLLLATTALALAVSSVLVIITELDRPHVHLIEVNQQAMEDVYQMMLEDQTRESRAAR